MTLTRDDVEAIWRAVNTDRVQPVGKLVASAEDWQAMIDRLDPLVTMKPRAESYGGPIVARPITADPIEAKE